MNFKKYALNTRSRIKATHFLVVFLLLINIVFFTQTALSAIVQLALVIVLIMHSKDEKTLKEEFESLEKRLREDSAIFDRNIIVSETDLNGIITYVNQKFCDVSGYSKEELIGKSHRVLRDPEASDDTFKQLWLSITAGNTFHAVLKNIGKSGAAYWVDSSISPIMVNSKIIGYKSIRFDITAQVLTKKALELNINETVGLLKEQSSRFEFAINSSRDGFWDYDLSKKEFYLSSGWKSRLGFKQNEGQTYLEYLSLIPDEYRFEHDRAMHDVIEERPNEFDFVHFRIKYPIVTKDGEKMLIEDVGDAFFDEQRELTRITGFHRDVTEQARQAKMIESQNRISAMGEMIGNIAHQWRQPIGAINNALNDLEFDIELEDLTHVEAAKFLQTSTKIKEYTAHLSNTIDDFRKISSDEKVKSNFLVANVIDDAYKIVATEYGKHKIDFSLSSVGECTCEFMGYERELLQVVINILNNAKDVLIEKEIKNPSVIVGLSRDDKHVHVSVHDNAGGIPDSIVEKIFDPYFTTKHESVGTGIGLYMSKKIIMDDFQGNLSVENVDGGAKFLISIPRPKKV